MLARISCKKLATGKPADGKGANDPSRQQGDRQQGLPFAESSHSGEPGAAETT